MNLECVQLDALLATLLPSSGSTNSELMTVAVSRWFTALSAPLLGLEYDSATQVLTVETAGGIPMMLAVQDPVVRACLTELLTMVCIAPWATTA